MTMNKITKQDIIDKINKIEHEGQVIEEDDDGLLNITIKLRNSILCSVSWRDCYPDNLISFCIFCERKLILSDFIDIDDFVHCIQNVIKRLQQEEQSEDST